MIKRKNVASLFHIFLYGIVEAALLIVTFYFDQTQQLIDRYYVLLMVWILYLQVSNMVKESFILPNSRPDVYQVWWVNDEEPLYLHRYSKAFFFIIYGIHLVFSMGFCCIFVDESIPWGVFLPVIKFLLILRAYQQLFVLPQRL